MTFINSMTKISGVVIHGESKGRTLGFPTANIKVEQDLNLDPGVYAGRIILNELKYGCALYLAGGKVIEAFIFDFAGDLYGKELQVEVLKIIRNKIVFKNNVEAVKQISEDVAEIKKCLQE